MGCHVIYPGLVLIFCLKQLDPVVRGRLELEYPDLHNHANTMAMLALCKKYFLRLRT